MIDDDKLAHLRTAYWLRGYARGMEELGDDNAPILQHQLRRASDMLEKVWDDYHVGATPESKKPVVDAVTGKQYAPMEFTEFWGER